VNSTATEADGSATGQGPVWGARARDWAEVQQGIQRPMFAAVLERTGVTTGSDLLDVGCGAGLLGAMAAERGACVTGIDAAPQMVEIAAEETPGADFRVGDMEALPYDDDSFDVITGINSFQFVANPVRAAKEAKRVVRCGGQVVMATWGKPEQCETARVLAALRPADAPPSPTRYWGPFALSQDGALASLAGQAGLKPVLEEDVDVPFDYPDLTTALRGLLSAGPTVVFMRSLGEEQVRRQVTAALEPFQTSSGGYHMRNTFRFLLAQAA
jgi:SAM-dependent methyltransferase